jgi:N-acetylglutamate synthase-like GNAT family acetyltransferase
MAASGSSTEVRRADRHDGRALRDLAARAGHVWVAEQDGEVMGLIVLVPSKDHLLVENVAMDPAQQGAGAGSRLLRPGFARVFFSKRIQP